MKRLLVSSLLIVTTINANELKDAFDAGIKSALKVIKYEKKNIQNKLQSGYCLSLKNENGYLTDYSIVKLESLSLILGYKPSLIANNFTKRKKVCFAIANTEDEIIKIKNDAKLKYKKFDKYFPKIEYIEASKYHREIPSVGKYNKDQTKVIDALSERIVELKMKLKKLNSVDIEKLRQKLDMAEEENEKLKDIIGRMKQNLRDKLNKLNKELAMITMTDDLDINKKPISSFNNLKVEVKNEEPKDVKLNVNKSPIIKAQKKDITIKKVNNRVMIIER